ncbi:hypothetical protein D3C78_1780800 [compost metagenome]
MFEKLRVAIWFCGQLNILLIMIQKGKAGMIPGLVDPLKVKHEFIMAGSVQRRMG